MRSALGWAPCCALVIALGAKAEAPARTALHWVRAPGAEQCIDPRTLAMRVEALTGPVFVRPAEAERSLEAEIAPHGRAFRARIRSVQRDGAPRGERTVESEGPDCRAIDAALAFVLAVTVDPELAGGAVPDELRGLFAEEVAPEEQLLAELDANPPAPVLLPEAPEPAPLAPASPPPPVLPVRPSARYVLSLAAGGLARTLPNLTPGLSLAGSIVYPRYVALALWTGLFPLSPAWQLDTGHEARFSAYAVGVGACPYAALGGRVRLGVCAGPELALLVGRGDGFTSDRTARLLDPALAASGGLTVGLSPRVGLLAHGGARVRITERRFVLEQVGERRGAFSPARIGVYFALGASVTF